MYLSDWFNIFTAMNSSPRRSQGSGKTKVEMGRTCVAGHQNFGRKELEECGIIWGRRAGNSEEGQGPQRAVVPMMMMMMMMMMNSSHSANCSTFFNHPIINTM
jgi:hypothetical protein